MAVVKTAFPHFEITDAVVRLWHEMLQEVDFKVAQANLREHILSNRFPPTIADIVRSDKMADYDRMKLETKEYFAQIEQWKQEAVPLPEHLIPKALMGGDDVD